MDANRSEASPSDSFDEELSRFASDLQLVHVKRGSLSLREIQKRANAHLGFNISNATLSATLNGKRLPRIDFLMALLRTLMIRDEDGIETSPPPHSSPALQPWRERWTTLETMRRARQKTTKHLAKNISPDLAIKSVVSEPLTSEQFSDELHRPARIDAAPSIHIPNPAHEAVTAIPGAAPNIYKLSEDSIRRKDGTPISALAERAINFLLEEGPIALPPMHGHLDAVRSVAFAPSGNIVGSVSDDSTVRLWDPTTGMQVGYTSDGHEGSVRDLAFSADGEVLVTGGG